MNKASDVVYDLEETGASPVDLEDGVWESSAIHLDPMQWYRISCLTKTGGAGYIAVRFYSRDGKEIADFRDRLHTRAKWQEQAFYFRARQHGLNSNLSFRTVDGPVDVKSATISPVEHQEVAEWAEKLGERLPPVPKLSVQSPSLPKTVDKLQTRRKRPVRLLMIGDSIASDVGNAPLDVMLEQAFPGAQVELYSSTVGSKDFTFYTKEDILEQLVLVYHPDLVMMCSNSGRSDFDGLAQLLQRLHDHSHAEVLVMTDPFGADGNPKAKQAVTHHASWLPDFEKIFANTANELGAVFFDLRRAWMDYISAQDLPYEYYLRDIHHAASPGRYVVGRLVQTCFERQQ